MAGSGAAGRVPPAAQVAVEGPWAQARDGDQLASVRLAELHAAGDLLEVVRGDSRRREAALGALAWAEDAELALGALAEEARRARDRARVLETILAVAGRPPSETEPFDPPGIARCIDLLRAMSKSRALPPEHRALASSALAAFARAGYRAHEEVPSEEKPITQ